MSDTRNQLERAFRLIEQGNTDEALDVLRPLTTLDPENPHVWWLMAYAMSEPVEVRSALLTVLRLDPNYSNADKARELLETLNQQHPPTKEEIARFPDELGRYSAFPDAFNADDDFFSSSDADSIFGDEPFGDIYTEPEGATDSLSFLDDDSFEQEFDDSIFALDEDDDVDIAQEEKPAKKSRAEKRAERQAEKARQKTEREAAQAAEAEMDDVTRLALEQGLSPDALDEDTLATLEEQAAQKRRGRRPLRIAALFLIIVFCLLAVVVLFGIGDDDTLADLEPLEAVDSSVAQAVTGLPGIESSVQGANFGANSQVVVAKTDAGTTVFVEFCSQPGIALADTIIRTMDMIAQQAASLDGQADAIGVSIDACNGDERDSLYRAFVPLADAITYAERGITQSNFQARWQRP